MEGKINDYIEWSQGGQKIILFTKHIIMVTECEGNTCNIELTDFEESIKAPFSFSDFKKMLLS